MPRNDAGSHDDDPGPIETGPIRKGAGSAGITIGKIQSSNFVVGNSSSVHRQVTQESSELLDKALRMTQELINALGQHEADLTEFDETWEAAAAVQTELASPEPKLRVVRRLVDVICVNVDGVAILANLAINIRQTVIHLSEVQVRRGMQTGKVSGGDAQNPE